MDYFSEVCENMAPLIGDEEFLEVVPFVKGSLSNLVGNLVHSKLFFHGLYVYIDI